MELGDLKDRFIAVYDAIAAFRNAFRTQLGQAPLIDADPFCGRSRRRLNGLRTRTPRHQLSVALPAAAQLAPSLAPSPANTGGPTVNPIARIVRRLAIGGRSRTSGDALKHR